MDGNETAVLVLGRSVGAAPADMEHAQFAVFHLHIGPLELFDFTDS